MRKEIPISSRLVFVRQVYTYNSLSVGINSAYLHLWICAGFDINFVLIFLYFVHRVIAVQFFLVGVLREGVDELSIVVRNR